MKKQRHTYKLKFYLNASHAIRWEGGIGQQHNHTWEIMVEIKTKDDQMVIFDDLEKSTKALFTGYSGKFLNEVAPFDTINPTLENVAQYFYDIVAAKEEEFQAELCRIEVGESPTRFYCIAPID